MVVDDWGRGFPARIVPINPEHCQAELSELWMARWKPEE
jgi:hypothetical protein